MITHFRTFFDLLEQNADFHAKHEREQEEEQEERQSNAEAFDIADSHPCGQHVLNSPWLTSELSHQPAAFRGNVGQRY